MRNKKEILRCQIAYKLIESTPQTTHIPKTAENLQLKKLNKSWIQIYIKKPPIWQLKPYPRKLQKF